MSGPEMFCPTYNGFATSGKCGLQPRFQLKPVKKPDPSNPSKKIEVTPFGRSQLASHFTNLTTFSAGLLGNVAEAGPSLGSHHFTHARLCVLRSSWMQRSSWKTSWTSTRTTSPTRPRAPQTLQMGLWTSLGPWCGGHPDDRTLHRQRGLRSCSNQEGQLHKAFGQTFKQYSSMLRITSTTTTQQHRHHEHHRHHRRRCRRRR